MAVGTFFPRALRYVWAQVGFALAVGIALTYVPNQGNLEPLHHVGIGLIVAAAVTTFWQFREFEEFFAKFSQEILIDDKYLDKLNEEALTLLRSRAACAILRNHVNNPSYERVPLGDWIDKLLYSSLLPSDEVGSGIYRDDFTDIIALEFLTLAEALEKVECSAVVEPASDLTRSVLKVTSTSTYRVIAPRLNDTRYKMYAVPYSGVGAHLPHFPLAQRISVRVGNDEQHAVDLDLVVTEGASGSIAYVAKPFELTFDANGFCQVWMRTVEYRAAEREPHILNTMSVLTRNLQVHIYQTGPGPKLVFDGGLMATGSKKEEQHGPSDFSLRYDGWLFEDHGYYIWWWS